MEISHIASYANERISRLEEVVMHWIVPNIPRDVLIPMYLVMQVALQIHYHVCWRHIALPKEVMTAILQCLKRIINPQSSKFCCLDSTVSQFCNVN